ncbi:MAG: hypothetical protein KME13_08150 [Myxacorys californica WJT36-NPBG1]|jgi:membrane-associated protein|nr:hypothetical protein [Myxacorys californica WJT36-NPBG1]
MNFFDVPHLQQTIEYLGFWDGLFVILGIIFAESGLLIGFFLPGDSLLFVLALRSSATFWDKFCLPSNSTSTPCRLS